MRISISASVAALLLASSCALAKADEPAQLYLAANHGEYVQYISLSVSGGYARGYLEDIRYDGNARDGISCKETVLTGALADDGSSLAFGTWTIRKRGAEIALTYPTDSGALREFVFEPASAATVNSAVQVVLASVGRMNESKRLANARAALVDTTAFEASNAATYARLQSVLAAATAHEADAARDADAATASAREKHAEAEALLRADKTGPADRTAAKKLQEALDGDLAAALAQSVLTKATSDVAVASDDLKVIADRIGSCSKRRAELMEVVRDAPAMQLASQKRTGGDAVPLNEKSPFVDALGAEIRP
jgi:hypothetical protein